MLANADRWVYLPHWGSLDERGLPELALALPSQSALPTAAGRLSGASPLPLDMGYLFWWDPTLSSRQLFSKGL